MACRSELGIGIGSVGTEVFWWSADNSPGFVGWLPSLAGQTPRRARLCGSEHSAASEEDNPAGFAYRAALANGLAPRLDVSFARALAMARSAGTTAPSPVKALAGSWVLSALPRSWAERLYRTV
jgi:hypothetical protein